MKVIIAGTRSIIDYPGTCKAIEASGFQVTEVVCGGATGPDTMGERWAKENGVPIKYFYPNWNNLEGVPDHFIRKNYRTGKLYNFMAGFQRNHEMGEYADALIAIWDGKSGGTKDMIDYARSKGLKVYVHEYKAWENEK